MVRTLKDVGPYSEYTYIDYLLEDWSLEDTINHGTTRVARWASPSYPPTPANPFSPGAPWSSTWDEVETDWYNKTFKRYYEYYNVIHVNLRLVDSTWSPTQDWYWNARVPTTTISQGWLSAEVPITDRIKLDSHSLYFNYNGTWIPIADYSISNPNSIIKSIDTTGRYNVDYNPGGGTDIAFPDAWWVASSSYLDWATFAIYTPYVCSFNLWTYSDAWWSDPQAAKSKITWQLQQSFSEIQQLNPTKPQNWDFNYVFTDAYKEWFWVIVYDCSYIDKNHNRFTTKIIVPFYYDWNDLYCYPYDLSWSHFTDWSHTHLYDPEDYAVTVFGQWDSYDLSKWEGQRWVNDVCGLKSIIYDLAKWIY